MKTKKILDFLFEELTGIIAVAMGLAAFVLPRPGFGTACTLSGLLLLAFYGAEKSGARAGRRAAAKWLLEIANMAEREQVVEVKTAAAKEEGTDAV